MDRETGEPLLVEGKPITSEKTFTPEESEGSVELSFTFDASGVDYPVVQGENNEYYLHYTFDRMENIAGSIFLDFRNRADFTDSKVILYGHNMQDGSMFSHLEKY